MKRAQWIVILALLTTAVGCSKSGDDLIVLQNGSRHTGELQACINASCQLNSQAIPQPTIAWIGFSYAGGPLPAVKNPATDEIHARDGSVEAGRMVSVSRSQVVTEKHSYDRTQVAWIHLAPRQGGGASPGGGASTPETDTLFHYDILVAGYTQVVMTVEGDSRPRFNGTMTATVDWTSTFTNVALKKKSSDRVDRTKFDIHFNDTGGVPAHGTTDAKYTLDDTKPHRPCQQTILFSRIDTKLWVDGSNSRTRDFNVQTQPYAEMERSEKWKQLDEVCPGGSEEFLIASRHGYPFVVVDGLSIDYTLDNLSVHAERSYTKEGPLLAPLKELANGDGFSFTTGKVKWHDPNPTCHPPVVCTVTRMTELKVNFTPRR